MKSPLRPPPSWLGGFVLGQSPLGAQNDFPVAPGVQKTILSYLYEEYSGDDRLEPFISVYNQLTQQYVDWFTTASLPVYTMQSGALLDWVALGLYGFLRPLLPVGSEKVFAAVNSFAVNAPKQPVNGWNIVEPSTFFQTSDDVFQRIITWHLYKGDGKQINTRWLKRRVARFLEGANGTGGNPIVSDVQMSIDSFGAPVFWPTFYDIDQTSQISITFAGTEATIRIVIVQRTVTGGAIPNRFVVNGAGSVPNSTFSTVVTFPLPALATIFQAAVAAGVVELPGPYTWIVQLS